MYIVFKYTEYNEANKQIKPIRETRFEIYHYSIDFLHEE